MSEVEIVGRPFVLAGNSDDGPPYWIKGEGGYRLLDWRPERQGLRWAVWEYINDLRTVRLGRYFTKRAARHRVALLDDMFLRRAYLRANQVADPR